MHASIIYKYHRWTLAVQIIQYRYCSTARFRDPEIELNPDQWFPVQSPDQEQIPVLTHLDSLRWIFLLPFGRRD